ncbi:MAG TPA: RNA methyltransferase [Steroidobacteraceae bacterium]|nr:RNA methyltransferase [Steroidobacteraceae bacterium]
MNPVPIRIVLVDTSHPGNVGATARAMKNMGLDQLVLVRPKLFPHAEAIARASGADDVLAAARVVPGVPEALAGCGFVLATTSRERDQYFRVLDVREAARRAVVAAATAPVGILFGAERTGLTNEDLQHAHALLRIPTSAVYASLNVAMAVQLVAYELWRERARPAADLTVREQPLAPPEEMARLYEHLQSVLEEIDFRDRTQSGTNLMNRFQRLLQRAELDVNEANILRGFLTSVQKKRRRAGEP